MEKTSFIFERKENKNKKTVKWLDWMTITIPKESEDTWRDSEKNDLESNERGPNVIIYNEEPIQKPIKVPKSAIKSRVSNTYNGTMDSQFKPTTKRVSYQVYDEKERNKWMNDSNIDEIGYVDLFFFYFTSLYNNKQYKFQFVE